MNSIKPDFSKSDGLIPAIIQDASSGRVLMLGYMNQEALDKTIESGKVHFFSRSKNRLWMKGETSGNILKFVTVALDCDADALLVRAEPVGPTCHTGSASCFGDSKDSGFSFLADLERLITARKEKGGEKSYVASLFHAGSKKIAQKVVEEAGEVALEAVGQSSELFKEEAADLLFHYLILLADKGVSLGDIAAVLAARHTQRKS